MHAEELKYLNDKKLCALEIDFDSRHVQGILTVSRIQFAKKRDTILQHIRR